MHLYSAVLHLLYQSLSCILMLWISCDKAFHCILMNTTIIRICTPFQATKQPKNNLQCTNSHITHCMIFWSIKYPTKYWMSEISLQKPGKVKCIFRICSKSLFTRLNSVSGNYLKLNKHASNYGALMSKSSALCHH